MPRCPTRKPTLKSLEGHWSRVGHDSPMPHVVPSARKNLILRPGMKIRKPRKKSTQPEITMDSLTKRRKISSISKKSLKEMPEGWTREKVAVAYDSAPKRGVPKSVFLDKWNQKYDFKLTKQKAGVWVNKFLRNKTVDTEDFFAFE